MEYYTARRMSELTVCSNRGQSHVTIEQRKPLPLVKDFKSCKAPAMDKMQNEPLLVEVGVVVALKQG